MLRRFIASLVAFAAVLALAVLTTVSASHAARMGAGPAGPMVHAAMAMQGHALAQPPGRGAPACPAAKGCGLDDMGLCAQICVGLVGIIPLSKPLRSREDASRLLVIPAGAPVFDHPSEPARRPPRPRLL